jgi:hypothetical protein
VKGMKKQKKKVVITIFVRRRWEMEENDLNSVHMWHFGGRITPENSTTILHVNSNLLVLRLVPIKRCYSHVDISAWIAIGWHHTRKFCSYGFYKSGGYYMLWKGAKRIRIPPPSFETVVGSFYTMFEVYSIDCKRRFGI